jgi:hypothetical protein
MDIIFKFVAVLQHLTVIDLFLIDDVESGLVHRFLSLPSSCDAELPC